MKKRKKYRKFSTYFITVAYSQKNKTTHTYIYDFDSIKWHTRKTLQNVQFLIQYTRLQHPIYFPKKKKKSGKKMKNKRKSFFLGKYLIYFYFQIKTNFSAHSDKKNNTVWRKTFCYSELCNTLNIIIINIIVMSNIFLEWNLFPLLWLVHKKKKLKI